MFVFFLLIYNIGIKYAVDSTSDEIVDMHGGTLTLENASGGGTLVTVRLPDSQ